MYRWPKIWQSDGWDHKRGSVMDDIRYWCDRGCALMNTCMNSQKLSRCEKLLVKRLPRILIKNVFEHKFPKTMNQFTRNKTSIIRQFFITNETEIHYYPMSKEQPMQSNMVTFHHQRRNIDLSTVGMLKWYLLLIIYHPNDKTIIGKYYVKLRDWLDPSIVKKHRIYKENIRFHQNNANPH